MQKSCSVEANRVPCAEFRGKQKHTRKNTQPGVFRIPLSSYHASGIWYLQNQSPRIGSFFRLLAAKVIATPTNSKTTEPVTATGIHTAPVRLNVGVAGASPAGVAGFCGGIAVSGFTGGFPGLTGVGGTAGGVDGFSGVGGVVGGVVGVGGFSGGVVGVGGVVGGVVGGFFGGGVVSLHKVM